MPGSEQYEVQKARGVVYAAQGGHTMTVKELHTLGADVKTAANDGRTAVMYAALGGHTATVKELHTLGADEPCEP